MRLFSIFTPLFKIEIMTKKTLFALFALICFTSLFVGCSSSKMEEEIVELPSINYRYATAEEGRQILLSNTAYFNSLTQNDLDWKFRCTGKTIEDFKTFSSNQIQDFTDTEKKVLDIMITQVEARLNELGIRLPNTEKIAIIKSTMENEGGAGGYTLGNSIFISGPFLQLVTNLWQGKENYTPDYDEYCYRYMPVLIAHEIFHCLSRNDTRFRQQLYSLINFSIMDHEVEFGPSVRNMLLANPDVERYDNWAEFTINGKKRRCILISIYESSYPEAEATEPGASFMNHMKSVLVPLDDPDTMIPIEQASDFYEVVGHNTDYVIAAEECLADMFGFLIGYGLNGYYKFVDYKNQFIPYQTPELIHGIHKTISELYN